MIDNFYYICNLCESVDEKACKLTTNTSPGIPPVCPFDLGFESDWKQVDEKEYNKTS